MRVGVRSCPESGDVAQHTVGRGDGDRYIHALENDARLFHRMRRGPALLECTPEIRREQVNAIGKCY